MLEGGRVSKRSWSALGRLWDSVLPGLISLNPIAMAYYEGVVLEEMPLTGSVDDRTSQLHPSAPSDLMSANPARIGWPA